MKRFCIFISLFALATLLDSLCVFPTYSGNVAWLPALITGALGVASSLTSGLFGKSSQDSVNAANIQMQRETNQQQLDMFNQNMDWTKYTYEDQKAYNERMLAEQRAYDDPRAQLKRFKDAGLNPYMMFGNMDAGKFQTAVAPTSSAPSVPSLTAPSMQAYDPTNAIQHGFDTVADATMGYFRLQGEAEDARAKHIDNITRLQENLTRIENMRQNTKGSKKQIEMYDAQIKRINKLLDVEYDQMANSAAFQKQETEKAKEEVETIKLQQKAQQLNNEYQEWFNDFSKKNGAAQLQVLKSTVAANMASADLSTKQSRVAIEERIIKQLEQKGIRIDNEQKKRMNKLLLKQQDLQNKGKELENKYGTNSWTFLGRALEWNKRTTRKNVTKVVNKKGHTLNGTSYWD